MNRQLIIEDAEGEERTYELLDERTVIGRGDDCEIRLASNSVSRSHLVITRAGDDLVVEDLGSSNGSLLNGEPLEHKMPLDTADLLEIGDFSISVDVPQGSAAAAAPNAGRVEETRRRADARRRQGRGRQALVLSGILAVVAGVLIVWAKNVVKDEDPSQSKDGTVASAEEAAASATDDEGQLAKKASPPAQPLIDSDERRRARERSAALETLGLELDQALIQDDFQGASAVLERFAKRHGKTPLAFTRRLASHLEKVTDKAVARYRRQTGEGRQDLGRAELEALASRMPADSESRTRLVDFIGQLSNTPVASNAGATPKTPTTEKPARPAKPATEGGSKPTPTASTPPSRTARAAVDALAARVETAWKSRDFAAVKLGADELDTLALDEPLAEDLDADLRRRLRLARRFVGLQEEFQRRFTNDASTFTAVADGSGKRRNLTSLDAKGLSFEGDAAPTAWSKIEDDTWLSLIAKAKLKGEGGLAAASYVLFAGKRERGQRMLRDVERQTPELAAAIQETLADNLGLEMPEGGFTWYDGRYVTRQDLIRLGAKKIIADGVANLSSQDPNDRADAYASLHGLGPRAASAFHRGLTAARDKVLTKATSLGGYQKLEKLGEMRTELEKLREHALELIFDEYEYPYPYNAGAAADRHAKANREIDSRKIPLRKLWENTMKAKISDELRSAVALVREYDFQMDQIGIGAAREAPSFLLYLPSDDTVHLRTFAWSAEERERIDTSYAWMQENDTRESNAKSNERQQVAITNAYRMMFGRHAVKLNDRLIESARMHSYDMTQRGFFAHENPYDPLKRTPWDRMRWVGFYGSGGSENISASSSDPRSPHIGWTHSSGHHRNILGRSWRLLGSGSSGRNWTQNFSNSEMTDEEREQAGLPKGGIRTLHKDKSKN